MSVPSSPSAVDVVRVEPGHRAVRLVDVITILAATVLSIGIQGFTVGVSNNAFHIPIVLGWPELPGFDADPYYQTLNRFVSAVWPLLGWVSTENNVEGVFFGAHVLSRAAALAAILRLLRHLGLAPLAQWAGVLLLTAAPVLYGYSRPAWHGLFIDYFTHTEATWPFVVLAWIAGVEGRWKAAGIHAGVCALLNLFVGVWALAVLIPLAAATVKPHPWSDAGALLRSLRSIGIWFAATSAPVLVWTAWAVVTAEPVDFSFADYVRFYFASHFLIDVAHPAEVANGLALWFCAQHLCRRLGWNAWRFVLILVMVIFTVGVVTPYLVDARLIFNLHLLRIDGVMWFFGSILAAAASVQLLTVSPRTSDAAGVAVVTLLGLVLGNFVATAATIVIFALLQDAARWRTRVGLTWSVILATVAVAAPASMTGDWGAAAAWALGGVALIATGTGSQTKIAPKVPGLAVGALVVLMALLYLRLGVGASTLAYLLVLSAVLMAWLAPAPLREWTEGRHGLVVSVVMLLCLSAVSAVSIVRNSPPALSPETASQKERDWLEIAAWVRVHPDTHVMLVPVRVEDEVAHRNFSLWAKTPVWVDRKQGAAVMWSPAFHGTWRPRYQEVLTLTSPDDFASYAQSHGIQRFVAPRRELTIDCPAPYRSEKLTTTYALCRT